MSSSQATPVQPDPNDGGGVGGNAASSPGPSSAYPWVSSVAGVSTATGNKLTEIPTVSWVARGGLTVDLTLYHNSEISFGSASRGAKWSLIYDTGLSSDASGNVHMGWGNGSRYDFGYSGGSYTPPPGIHDRLVANGSPITSYDLIKKDQTDWHFAHYGNPGNFLLVSISDENGNTIAMNRAANGGLLGLTDPTGRGVTFGYNSTYYTSIQDPLGRVINFGFDGSGNLSSVTYPILNGTSYSLNLGYDGNHNVTSIQDLRGNTSLLSYNAADNSLAWQQDNAGNRTTFTYGYDGVRNITNALATTVTDANSHSTAYNYDSTGRLSTVYDALGNHDAYTFDAANNQTQRVDRRSNPWNNTYDGMGNVLTSSDPNTYTTTYTYNGHNRPLTIRQPLGRSAAATYDSSDNLTQVQEKDAGGNLKAMTTYAYSGGYGLMTGKTDNNSHTTLYSYNYNGYLTSVTTPLGHPTQWAYDNLGFQTSRIDAANRTTTYTPDAWERNVQTTYPDSTTATFGYDANSNLTNFNNYTANWSRTYDIDDRETAEYCSGTQAIRYTYDATGQKGLKGSFTDSSGRTVSYTYTSRNELFQVSEGQYPTVYYYDANGNETSAYKPNNLYTTSYYNSDNTLNSYYNFLYSGNVCLSAYNYTYNADHQLTQANEGTGLSGPSSNPTVTAYGYDGQGHLSSEVRTGTTPYTRSFTCDGVGDRVAEGGNNLSGTFTNDADDQMRSYNDNTGAAALGYDALGQRIIETTGIAPGFAGYTTQYGYDFDGQLTSITKSGNTTTFRYDPLGRQVSRTVNGVTTGFGFDGNQLILEGQSTLTATYTWGNGLIRRNGEYPLTDGRGTTRQTTDGSGSGSITATSVSEGFGQTVGGSGSTSNPYVSHGSDGYRSDGDGPTYSAPLQKVGARYYDPQFGVFLTRDMDLSQKPYQYCDGDPINCTDPSGYTKKKVTKTTTVVTPNANGSTTATTSHEYDDGSSDSSTTTTAPGSDKGNGSAPGNTGPGSGAPGGAKATGGTIIYSFKQATGPTVPYSYGVGYSQNGTSFMVTGNKYGINGISGSFPVNWFDR